MRLKPAPAALRITPRKTSPAAAAPTARSYERAKSARRRARRGTTSERGYDHQYDELREQAIAATLSARPPTKSCHSR